MATERSAQAMVGLTPTAQAVLDWLRQRFSQGRPRAYSPVEIARGVFGRAEGPTPGVLFEPHHWPDAIKAVALLRERGLVEVGRLPQGDMGFRLRV